MSVFVIENKLVRKVFIFKCYSLAVWKLSLFHGLLSSQLTFFVSVFTAPARHFCAELLLACHGEQHIPKGRSQRLLETGLAELPFPPP